MTVWHNTLEIRVVLLDDLHGFFQLEFKFVDFFLFLAVQEAHVNHRAEQSQRENDHGKEDTRVRRKRSTLWLVFLRLADLDREVRAIEP